MLSYEKELWNAGCLRVAGVDEAGRGPLAGPVSAAAVVFSRDAVESGLIAFLDEINDSKTIVESKREEIFRQISDCEWIEFGVAMVPAARIDEINILNATREAMMAALDGLSPVAEHALIDGKPLKDLHPSPVFIVKGDSRSLSIAAASIVAKVTRDRIMYEVDREYPQYGFARNKGYGTREHLEAIRRHGPCPAHRRTFSPVSHMITPGLGL